MDKEGLISALVSLAIISIVLVATISSVIQNKKMIGPVMVIFGFIPWIPLILSERGIKSTGADIIFGIMDTGPLVIAALVGAEYAGILGAIVGSAVGDSITDGFAGVFEGKFSEYLRRQGIEEARTALSSSMGKMSGCLLGAGTTLTIAWTVLGL